MTTMTHPGAIQTPSLTTEQLALILGMKPQTLRKHHSEFGSYYGIRPSKLPNGKLRWPSNALDILTGEKQ